METGLWRSLAAKGKRETVVARKEETGGAREAQAAERTVRKIRGYDWWLEGRQEWLVQETPLPFQHKKQQGFECVIVPQSEGPLDGSVPSGGGRPAPGRDREL